MKARYSKLRNDMFWNFTCPHCYREIKWSGYDDAYWWGQVSKSEHIKTKACKCGKVYEIDFDTDKVKEKACSEAS